MGINPLTKRVMPLRELGKRLLGQPCYAALSERCNISKK